MTSTPIPPERPINIKLLLIGNSYVGKSCLMLRFLDQQWLLEDNISKISPTIGLDFKVSTKFLRLISLLSSITVGFCTYGLEGDARTDLLMMIYRLLWS
jgi:hypothetical protein